MQISKNDFAPVSTLMYYDTKDLLRENDKNGRGHGEITTLLFGGGGGGGGGHPCNRLQ